MARKTSKSNIVAFKVEDDLAEPPPPDELRAASSEAAARGGRPVGRR